MYLSTEIKCSVILQLSRCQGLLKCLLLSQAQPKPSRTPHCQDSQFLLFQLKEGSFPRLPSGSFISAISILFLQISKHFTSNIFRILEATAFSSIPSKLYNIYFKAHPDDSMSCLIANNLSDEELICKSGN